MPAIFTLCPECGSSEMDWIGDPDWQRVPDRFVCRQCETVWIVAERAPGEMPEVEVISPGRRHTPGLVNYPAAS